MARALAWIALGLAAAYVAGWALLLAANCPDDGPCTGARVTLSDVGGLTIYATTAGLILTGFAGILAALADLIRRAGRRLFT